MLNVQCMQLTYLVTGNVNEKFSGFECQILYLISAFAKKINSFLLIVIAYNDF